ncbi:MAG: tRNA (adenosine(37)-N6)-threonylcarbamoyltransferase complex ATPase subunit type 1 TsaE, partial [Desulfobacterota bacterium]|nr:tRNA (adenosine(37)-N6)-threonylcarbamoyltransferase complex ATPase subunit type 1 TsaE [Thermodesulfobacteriota bacterium]
MVSFSWEVETIGEEATETLGERLASCLQPGDVVALSGELGAGKTCLVRGLARGLGVDDVLVASPSFTLLHEYEGRLPLYHLDCYRLADPEAMAELGLDDYFQGGGVLAIEWAERVPYLPEERLEVVIEWLDESRRRIRLAARGAPAQRLQEKIA